MGIVKCYVCKMMPPYNLFWIWSSSKQFPKMKLMQKMNIKSKMEKKNIYDGVEVCINCYNKLMDEK